jgi:hypothetical protein
MNKLVVDLLQQKGLGRWKVLKNRHKHKNVSSAHKPDGLGKIKEHAPRSEHVRLHQDIGRIRTRTQEIRPLKQIVTPSPPSSLVPLFAIPDPFTMKTPCIQLQGMQITLLPLAQRQQLPLCFFPPAL